MPDIFFNKIFNKKDGKANTNQRKGKKKKIFLLKLEAFWYQVKSIMNCIFQKNSRKAT